MNREDFNKAEDERIEAEIEQGGGLISFMEDLNPADPETQAFFSRLINERRVNPLVPVHTLSIDTAALMASLSSREQQVLLIHELLHKQTLRNFRERELREETPYKINHAIFPIEPKQKPKPTWQDRRQQSLDAKQALVAKMKGTRK